MTNALDDERDDALDDERNDERDDRGSTAPLWALAGATALLHLLTNHRYGFHRDELQFLSDARHLTWGFVAYPPLTPLLEHIGLRLFGLSLEGLRLFSVLAQSVVVLVSGLMARELGGRRLAQFAAAFAVALSGLPLFEGTEFQYSSFDYLWWVLTGYFVIRLLKETQPRWWLAIGLTLGLGLETKYSVCYFIAGLLAGFLLTPARRLLWTTWFAAGVAIALLIFLPNFLWQVQHHFISIHFLQHIHKRDVGEGRADGFLTDQLKLCANFFAAPMWLYGLISCFRQSWRHRRYAALGWMYLVPFALFYFGKGRFYYVAPAYPSLLALGAVAGEQWLATLRRPWKRIIAGSFFSTVLAYGLLLIVILVPVVTGGPLQTFSLSMNGDLREEFGWTELVSTVAGIRDALPPAQRAHLGIVTGNYGEQGAIELLGAPLHLPTPISMTNSAWLRGYPSPQPPTLIVIGFSREDADRAFTSCRWAGHNGNSHGIRNEESEFHPDIFLCGPPRLPWPEFWQTYQSFG